jgi:hypothetical protein
MSKKKKRRKEEKKKRRKEEKKKRRKVTFVTLSLTKIEVTSFNSLGSRICDGEGHA